MNPAAAKHPVVVVEYGGLPRSDAECTVTQPDHRSGRPLQTDGAGQGTLLIPQRDSTTEVRLWCIHQPVDVGDSYPSHGQIFTTTENNLASLWLDSNDKPRFTKCDPQTFTLTDRELFITGVLSQDIAVRIDEITSGFR